MVRTFVQLSLTIETLVSSKVLTRYLLSEYVDEHILWSSILLRVKSELSTMTWEALNNQAIGHLPDLMYSYFLLFTLLSILEEWAFTLIKENLLFLIDILILIAR